MLRLHSFTQRHESRLNALALLALALISVSACSRSDSGKEGSQTHFTQEGESDEGNMTTVAPEAGTAADEMSAETSELDGDSAATDPDEEEAAGVQRVSDPEGTDSDEMMSTDGAPPPQEQPTDGGAPADASSIASVTEDPANEAEAGAMSAPSSSPSVDNDADAAAVVDGMTGVATAENSPGEVTVIVQIEEPELYCVIGESGLAVGFSTASGSYVSNGRPPLCGLDCGTCAYTTEQCTPPPSPIDIGIPNYPPAPEYELVFDGVLGVNGTCGQADSFCQTRRYIAPGSYQVEVCVNLSGGPEGTLPDDCRPETERVCQSAQFDYPSAEPVFIVFGADE